MTLPKNVINYLKGLMSVFENANCVSLAKVAKCSHDSLPRVLEGKSLCWQTLLTSFILRTFGKLQDGYLMIDDTTISKNFAKKIENISWIYDSKIGRSILGLQIVVIAWSNGAITLPLALRVYQKDSKKSKIDLACELLQYCKKRGIKPEYVSFDSWYAASQVFKTLAILKWHWVTRLKRNRKLDGVSLQKTARNPYWMKVRTLSGGMKVLVVRHGKKYFASSMLTLSKKELLSFYKGRWKIETIFKMLHSKLGLDECQSRTLSAQTTHFHLCMMAYSALEKESFIQKISLYHMKRNCSFNFQYPDNILSHLFSQGA